MALSSVSHVNAFLQGVLLRRTKQSKLDGKPILDLPPCEQTLRRIELTPQERAFYDQIKAESQSYVRGLQEHSGCAFCAAHDALCAPHNKASRGPHHGHEPLAQCTYCGTAKTAD
jgi:hypothetical protein